MDPEYAVVYRDLYAQHWWWRAREELILQTVRTLLPKSPESRILDVGCGDGLLFEKLAPLGHVEGIEMDPAGVTPEGRWRDRIRVQPFDEKFQPEHLYDLVLLLDVLEHFEDPGRRLARAFELLEPGGAILVTVPAFLALWTSHDELNRHFTRYTRRRLADLASQAGARIESSRYFFQWLFPLKLAVRLREAVWRAKPAPPSVPASWINRTLYRLSKVEQSLTTGWPVPFGTSLLAVLRRQ